MSDQSLLNFRVEMYEFPFFPFFFSGQSDLDRTIFGTFNITSLLPNYNNNKNNNQRKQYDFFPVHSGHDSNDV